MPPAWLERKSGAPSLPGAHLVGIVLAPQRRRREAVADLDALDGVDRHQRRGEVGVELAVDRRAEARRHALGDDLDHGADRGAVLADAVEIVSKNAAALASGQKNGLLPTSSQSQLRAVDRVRPHLHQRAADVDARQTLRAMAPAATRAAVSRAEERPPPR